MRPARQRLNEGLGANLFAAVVFSLGLTIGPPPGDASDFQPPTGSVLVGQFTIGGCLSVCETLAMCDDAHINEKNGDCWLVLDKTHADITALARSCSGPDERRFSAEMSDETWRLTCASATDEDISPRPRAIESLPDIEPF